MILTLITAPADRPLTLDAAKTHLRVEHDDDNDLIDQLIDAALGHIDGRDGWLRHALEPQTWEMLLDDFPCGETSDIPVPLPPLISVDEITYLDADGDEQTLAEALYEVVPSSGVKWAVIRPAADQTWPTTPRVRGRVRVVFTAGYPRREDESPPVMGTQVPAPLVTALKFQVEAYYTRDPDRAELLQNTADRFAGRFRSLAE